MVCENSKMNEGNQTAPGQAISGSSTTMSNSLEDQQTLEPEQQQAAKDQNPSNQQSDQTQEWETMARAWVCAFPDAKAVSTSEVEAWVDNNRDFLAEELKSMPRNQLMASFLKIQEHLRPPTQVKEADQLVLPPARFQRTDHWRPAYSWLETLDKDEVVKSKDISDWLTENPDIREQLCSRHSRYHLMHYIKKCHMKILKRKDRKKRSQQSDKATSPKVQKTEVSKELVLFPSNPLGNIPKDSDLYLAKRNEASRKYEILVELEKQLFTILPDCQKI